MKKVQILAVSAILLFAVSCKKRGCMDPLANNYSAEAEKDNGNCDFSAIEITDDITVNTTWTANKAYVVMNGIDVTNNATLVIEPGTIIRFKEDAYIDVSYNGNFGTIKAIGTTAKPITFTSDSQVKNAGDWGGVWLYDGANSCEFNYCNFNYGSGYSDYSGYITVRGGDNVVIDNCSFINAQYFGVYHDAGTFSSMTNNSFSSTGLNNLRIELMNVDEIGVGNTYTTDILVAGGYLDKAGDVTWLYPGTAFEIDGYISVGSDTGTKLILKPGCTLKFGSNDELSIGYNYTGLIEAIGTVSQPITFTSKSNYPSKGDWDGIWFYSYSVTGSTFDHCVFEYGGGYSSSSANIIYKNGQGSNVTVTNSTLKHSAGYGMMLDQVSDTSYPTLNNNIYSDNTSGNKNW